MYDITYTYGQYDYIYISFYAIFTKIIFNSFIAY